MEANKIFALTTKHNTQLRLLNQITHFSQLKETAQNVLENLPDRMAKTSKSYKKRIEKYTDLINKLTKSYQKL